MSSNMGMDGVQEALNDMLDGLGGTKGLIVTDERDVPAAEPEAELG
jgi:hypothetical protein